VWSLGDPVCRYRVSNDDKARNASTHGLPKYGVLTKDGRTIGPQGTDKWPEDFGENDGGTIRDLGNGAVFYLINYDNTYHRRYRLQQRGDLARDVVRVFETFTASRMLPVASE
jgi:hypothetical protein